MRLSAYISETENATEIISFYRVDDMFFMFIFEAIDTVDGDVFEYDERHDITESEYFDYSRQCAHTKTLLDSGEPAMTY